MKVEKTKDQIQILRFENKDLENDMVDKNQEGLDLSNVLGKDQATQLQPSLRETSSGLMFYNKVRYHFQRNVSYIKSVLQPNLTQATNIDHKTYDSKEKRIQTELRETNHACDLAKREVQKSEEKGDHVYIAKKRRFRWVRLLCILLVSADFFFSASSLQKIGFSFLAAHIVAGAIATAIYFAAEMTPVWLEKASSKKAKRIRAVAIFIAFTIIFSFLAYLRTTNEDGESGQMMRRLAFIVLNLFLVGISILLIAQTRVTKKEQEQLDRYYTLKTKEKEASQHKVELEQKLDQVIKERKELVDAETALMIYGADLEQQVVDAYHSAFSEYCATNLYNRSDYRADAKPPRFFNQAPKPLSLYFPKQKKQ